MPLPINLVLVRHGESEGNVANRLSRKGDHSAFTEEFKKRHTSLWRLTDKGIWQSQESGIWIRENIIERFDRYYVSEYIRAIETAGHQNCPNAIWFRDYYLRERDWGDIGLLSYEEIMAKYRAEFEARKRDGFYWVPPGGMSLAWTSILVDRMFGTLARECPDMNVLMVLHGEIMWIARVRLERMSQIRYTELDRSKHPFDRIHNCQILHYTRRNPETAELSPYLDWFRSVCPWDLSLSSNKWQKIVRPTYTNEDLLAEAESVPRLINNK